MNGLPFIFCFKQGVWFDGERENFGDGVVEGAVKKKWWFFVFVDFLVIVGGLMVGSPVYGGFGVKNVVCQMVPEVGFDAARPCQEVVFCQKGVEALF